MSRREYVLTVALLTIPFKLSVLPKLLSLDLKTDGLIALFFLVAIEVLLTTLIYKVSQNGGVQNILKGAVCKIFCVFVALVLVVKCILATTELFYYCSSSLFEGANGQVFLLTSLPVAFFVGSRKDRTLGRIAQVVIPVIYLSVALNVAFSTEQPKPDNILPLFQMPLGKTAAVSLRYLWYVGDALPLIFVGVEPSKSDLKPCFPYIRFALHGVIVLSFYALFYAVYSDTLSYIGNVFNRMASFNALTRDLNGLELLAVVSWSSAALIALGCYAHAFFKTCTALFNRKKFIYPTYLCFFVSLEVLCFILANRLTDFENLYFKSFFSYFGALPLTIAIVIFFVGLSEKKRQYLQI